MLCSNVSVVLLLSTLLCFDVINTIEAAFGNATIVKADVSNEIFNGLSSKSVLRKQSNHHTTVTDFEYEFGNRKKGDRVVFKGCDHDDFDVPRSFDLQLTVGNAMEVTQIAIKVEKSNDVGHVYFLKGGIGQKYAMLVVQARNVTFFNWAAKFYGI